MPDYPQFIRDAAEVDVIESIPDDDPSQVKQELRKSIFNFIEPPKKKPESLTPSQFRAEQEDRIEQGLADNYDEAYDLVAQPDEARVKDQLDTYYTILTDYDPVPGGVGVLCYIAPTVARNELSTNETLWYGTFETAKQTGEDEWEAVCFSALDPVEDYSSSEMHTSEADDDVWLPTYGVKQLWQVYDHPPEDALHLARSDDDASLECDRDYPDEADIHIHSPHSYQYGTQFILECPKEAADAVKDIPEEEAYQSFSSIHSHWRFDADGLLVAIDTLTKAGWTVAISPTIETRYLELYLNDSDIATGDLPPVPAC